MNFFDKVWGWLGRAVDKVQDLLARIQDRVDEAQEIAVVAAKAVKKHGDRLAALEPEDAAWLFGPVLSAVAAAQANALVTGAIGRERLEAVRLALLLAQAGVEKADDYFDAKWAKVNPYIEAFIAQAKEDEVLGFSNI